ncbi:MAG: tRNA pseudouridine(55) synthase TruB [Bacteroidetes bacterium]|nr:MAG: tRNA pseudouridine(55) synthase TruB [Bacteroidota bacterium]
MNSNDGSGLKDYSSPEGHVLLVDKPLEWTSFDVVKKLKYALNLKKVGHAGTLDPLATGLLILCTGKKTKQIESYQNQGKEYEGTLVLGQTTPSYDLETEPTEAKDITKITKEQITEATGNFIGDVEQTPPIYSAVKINGKRAYLHARKGDDIKLRSRVVKIDRFDIISIDLPEVKFLVSCSKGTYIRSLVNDFGGQLGVGAYLSQLRRTKIGDYKVTDAYTIEELTA